MSLCQSCGGIIGRDCFHPNDCADIAYRMEMSQRIGDGQFDDRDSRIADLEARVRKVEASRDKAVKSLTQYGYTDCGGELWKPPLGKRPDFDRIDRLESDLAAARVTIGELVGGLKPFAKDANWHCTVGDDEAFSMNLDGNCSFVPNFVVGDFRRAAALVARHQAQQ